MSKISTVIAEVETLLQAQRAEAELGRKSSNPIIAATQIVLDSANANDRFLLKLIKAQQAEIEALTKRLSTLEMIDARRI